MNEVKDNRSGYTEPTILNATDHLVKRWGFFP